MSRRVLFVCDPLDGFATYKDTTFAMMRECQKRGIEIHTASLAELRAVADHGQSRLEVFSHHILIDQADRQPWWVENDAGWREATGFDVIVMRKDPPFDQDYFVATQLLEIAERQGVPVVNSPQALRNHGEKMAALEFPGLTPPTLISSSMQSIKEFAAHHEKIVIKPLDAMGGTGVFVLESRDPNLPSAVEMLTSVGTKSIVAQRYLPEIVHGDKRVIVINGEPVPHVLARIPPPGQSRGNLAAGGKGVVQPISDQDFEIAQTVGKALAPRGLQLIGLDIIGHCLTEINVTSPTGFQEISAQSGVDVAAIFIDAVMPRQ
jgi:glutathione synthase